MLLCNQDLEKAGLREEGGRHDTRAGALHHQPDPFGDLTLIGLLPAFIPALWKALSTPSPTPRHYQELPMPFAFTLTSVAWIIGALALSEEQLEALASMGFP